MAEIADCPVPFKILVRPTGSIGGGPGGWGASLAFHVGSKVGGTGMDVLAFLQFIGGTTETTVLDGISVDRIVPLRHPYFPDMVAIGVHAEGTGGGIDAPPGWSDWRVMVDFAVVPYGFTGDQAYLTLRRRYGASAITLPGRAYAISSVPLNHDVAVAMPEVIYSATKYNVPTLDDSIYKTLVGKVNNATFLGYDAETVRFDGVEDEITTTIGFVTNRTVSLSLAWRPRSWNQVLLPSGVWGTPLNVSDSSKLYTAASFTPLLY